MNQKNFGELILRFKKEFPGSCVVIDNNGILLGIRVPVSLHEIPREFLEDAVSVGLKIFFKTWTSRPAPWRGLFLFELRIAKIEFRFFLWYNIIRLLPYEGGRKMKKEQSAHFKNLVSLISRKYSVTIIVKNGIVIGVRIPDTLHGFLTNFPETYLSDFDEMRLKLYFSP